MISLTSKKLSCDDVDVDSFQNQFGASKETIIDKHILKVCLEFNIHIYKSSSLGNVVN